MPDPPATETTLAEPLRAGIPVADFPLSRRRVQATLGVIAVIAIAAMAVSVNLSEPQHNAIGTDGEAVSLRIDLNTADLRELTLLPGVGDVLAKRIVANRDRLGSFRSVGELRRVHGIGDKTIERLGEVCEASP